MMMKAVEFKFKSDDHRVVDNVTKPIPAQDEVVVKVKYSAIDTAAQPIVDKEFVARFIHKLKGPLYMGYHFSGTVDAAGSEVKGLEKGVDVFGFLQYTSSQTQGAFAEYITVKQSECAVKPKDVAFDVAAASSTESITALQALIKGGLSTEATTKQTVLVVGAAGGVGSAAVQIARKLFGANVTAVSSTRDVEQVKNVLGADVVMDRTADPKYVRTLIKEKAQFDMIFDAPCALPSSATKLLSRKGVIVTTFPSGTMFLNQTKMAFSSKRACAIECDSNAKDLKTIGELLASKDPLVVPIDSTFKVKDIVQAMAKHAGRKSGRIVIQVENGWD